MKKYLANGYVTCFLILASFFCFARVALLIPEPSSPAAWWAAFAGFALALLASAIARGKKSLTSM